MKTIEQRAFELCNSDIDKLNFIMQKTRKPEVTIVRFEIINKLRKLGFTVISIADFFGFSDHSPICNAIKRDNERIEFEERIKKHVRL